MGGLRLNSFSGFCCAVIEVVVSLKATRQSPMPPFDEWRIARDALKKEVTDHGRV